MRGLLLGASPLPKFDVELENEPVNARTPWITLAAGMLLTGSLGSIRAFSVFVAPLELDLGASRTAISGLYSVALIALTISVLTGHVFYHRLRAP